MTWLDAVAGRISSWGKRLGMGALGAWSCLACSTLVAGGSPPPAMVGVFALGVLAACLMVMVAAGALLLSSLPTASPRADARWSGRDLGLLVLSQLAVTAALAWSLSAPMAWLAPARLSFHDEIGRVVAWHIASALVAASSLWLLRRRGGYPFWTWGVLHLVVRLSTDDEIAIVSVGREHWVDLGSALFYLAVFSAPGPAVRALSKLWVALLPIAVVCVLVTFGSIDRAHRSRAELSQSYPALSSLLALAQSLLDLDGDGFASMLGGRDCDDGNRLVDPMAMEIVANGLDDNCIGGDLQRHVARGPARRVADLQRNVVLVTIDSLRAEALALDGRPDDAMPQLRDWSRRGAAVFTRAYVAAPFTQDSLYALMTGNYPMNMTQGRRWLGAEADLPTVLAEVGYRSQIVQQLAFKEADGFRDPRRHPSRRQRRYRLYDNFDDVDDELVHQNIHSRGVTSEETTTRAIAHFDRLSRAGQPFLLWVHYYDPHAEYMPHAGTPFPGASSTARYWQEVWSTDKALGRLLSHLESAGHLERGVVALTGDHGESLGENGRYGHATCLAERCLRTVLVLRGVSIEPGTYPTRVRVFDLFPTLLELAAGIRIDRDAESLASIWRSGRVADRDVFARTSYEGRVLRRAAIVGKWKLTEDVLAGSLSLHDIERDPAETTNLIEAEPRHAASLGQRMGEVWDRSMNDRLMQERARSVLHELCRAGDRRACAAVQQGQSRAAHGTTAD